MDSRSAVAIRHKGGGDLCERCGLRCFFFPYLGCGAQERPTTLVHRFHGVEPLQLVTARRFSRLCDQGDTSDRSTCRPTATFASTRRRIHSATVGRGRGRVGWLPRGEEVRLMVQTQRPQRTDDRPSEMSAKRRSRAWAGARSCATVDNESSRAREWQITLGADSYQRGDRRVPTCSC